MTGSSAPLRGFTLRQAESSGTSSFSNAQFRAALRIVRIRFAEARRRLLLVVGTGLLAVPLTVANFCPAARSLRRQGVMPIANLIRGQIANYHLTKLRECARAPVCGARVADAHADSHRRPSISRRSNRTGTAGRRKADSSIMVRCYRSRSAATVLVTICIPTSRTYVSVG